MPVGELLRSQRRWGRTRARKFLFSIAVNENRELGRLTSRQRDAARRRAGGQATQPRCDRLDRAARAQHERSTGRAPRRPPRRRLRADGRRLRSRC